MITVGEAPPARSVAKPGTSAAWVALLYTSLTVLLAYPLSVKLASHVLWATPDTKLWLWTLEWDVHALVHHPLSLFDANIYFPMRDTLAYSENLVGSALVAAPVLWLTGNAVLAMNLVTLLSCVLCALGAWLLARRLGIGMAGAIICGLIFGFSPPRFMRITQFHVATIEWVPFSLAYLHAYLDEGRPRDLRLAIGLFTLQAWTSGHGAVFLCLAGGSLIAYRVIRGGGITRWIRSWRDLGVTGLVLLLPLLPLAVAYHAAQVDGVRRSLDDAAIWAATPASFLASPSHVQTWLLALVGHPEINQLARAYLFPGFLPLLLAAAGWLLWRPQAGGDESAAPAGIADRQRHARIFYTLLSTLCVWLAVGPPIGLWPFVYWLPGFNFIRVPSRFVVLGILGIGVLAGFGTEALVRRGPRWKGGTAAVAIGGLLVAEFACFPLHVAAFRIEIPAVDRWVASLPGSFAIAEVPEGDPKDIGSWERRQTTYMLHSTAHWQKTVHGYSGNRPHDLTVLYSELTGFPSQASLQHLAALHVRYVIVHPALYERGEWPRIERRLNRYSNWLTLIHEDASGLVFWLRPPPPDQSG